MSRSFKDDYEGALWAIATGEIKDEPDNSFDNLQVVRGIAQEALGDKWDKFKAQTK